MNKILFEKSLFNKLELIFNSEALQYEYIDILDYIQSFIKVSVIKDVKMIFKPLYEEDKIVILFIYIKNKYDYSLKIEWLTLFENLNNYTQEKIKRY